MSDSPPRPLTFRPVTDETWPDLEALFMAPSGPKYCWCMVFRGTSAERREWTAAATKSRGDGRLSEANLLRRKALKARLDGGTPIGLVGYDGAEPVAWVSIAPKASHLRLGGPDPDPDRPGAVWSLACLYLKRRWRHAGHTRSMVEAAASYARREGARVLEAYPVRPDSPSFRYMGFVPTYEALGFRSIGPAGTRRTVMQLDLV
jgi:GNAT superfamily N-acetyltransferase